MNSFTIRRTVVSDSAALAELAARTFAETFAAENSPEDLAAHLRSSHGVAQQSAEVEDRVVISLLAFQGEELAGFAQTPSPKLRVIR